MHLLEVSFLDSAAADLLEFGMNEPWLELLVCLLPPIIQCALVCGVCRHRSVGTDGELISSPS